jgi:hypothetical protein
MPSHKLEVHDDLIDPQDKNNFWTWKFCAPVFITNQFGLLLVKDEELVPRDKRLPGIRNGTLTFVSYNDKVYGITCDHVKKALDEKNKLNTEKLGKWVSDEVKANLPPQAQLHFFIPHGEQQIHVNSRFHSVPGDASTGDYPDVCIAQINAEMLRQIDGVPIPLADDPNPEILTNPGFCGIATGYPEKKRRDIPFGYLKNLAISTIMACAPFNEFNSAKILLYAELDKDPEADNLSGMSGGPILWSTNKHWGLAGICVLARDLMGEVENKDSITKGPTIWIEGQRIKRGDLINWIEALPASEQSIPDLSKRLLIPKNYKPRS